MLFQEKSECYQDDTEEFDASGAHQQAQMARREEISGNKKADSFLNRLF